MYISIQYTLHNIYITYECTVNSCQKPPNCISTAYLALRACLLCVFVYFQAHGSSFKYREFLVKWKDKSFWECSWVSEVRVSATLLLVLCVVLTLCTHIHTYVCMYVHVSYCRLMCTKHSCYVHTCGKITWIYPHH